MRNILDKGTRCLLVQPGCLENTYYNCTEVCRLMGAKYLEPPLGLLTAAALLPQQWEFKLVDENVEPLLKDHFQWADIVCTGGMLPQQNGILAVVDRAHEAGRPVVVGGADPTLQPNLYQSADFLVQNEGEVTIPLLLEDLAKNATSGQYATEEKADLAEAVVPRFDLIRFKDYILVGIEHTRGCPYTCEFCNIIEIFGRRPRSKTPDHVISELQALYDLGYNGYVEIVDDNFGGNRGEARRLLPVVREWSKRHKNPFFFSAQASLSLADDDEILQLMHDTDFRMVFIGVETAEDNTLKTANKWQNVGRSIDSDVQRFLSHGMLVNAGFVIGFDAETDRTAENMIGLIRDSSFSLTTISRLTAIPGTQLARRLEAEGRLHDTAIVLGDDPGQVDQTTAGLNFDTKRPRVEILRDFARVLDFAYGTEPYYERIRRACLAVRPSKNYRPNLAAMLRGTIAFVRLCAKAGFNRTTGPLYWKLIGEVLWRNPRAFEQACACVATFIHLHEQSGFAVEHTRQEISSIETSEGNGLPGQGRG